MNSISLTAGKEVPASFLRGAPTVLKLALKHLDDPITLTIMTGIFAHGACSARDLGPSFDVVVLVRALLDALKGPHVSRYMFDHAIACFTVHSYKAVEKCEHMDSFVTLMATLLRSKDLGLRCRALYGVQHLKLQSLGPSVNETAVESEDSKKYCTRTVLLVSDVKGGDLPEALKKAADKYGHDRLFMTQLQRGRVAYAALFVRYNVETDLLPLARELACLVYDYQFALPDVLCSCCGDLTKCEPCLSQRPWVEIAQRCFKALRKQDAPSKQDLLYANMLEWKTLCHTNAETLYRFCKTALEENPQCPLFYHLPAPTRNIGAEIPLRLAKKGLKCPNVPEWLRIELTTTAVLAAWQTAIGLMRADAVSAYP